MNFKTKQYYIIYLLIILFSTSCQDVIKIELPDDEKSKLCIDAYIYEDSFATAILTLSLPYFEASGNPPVKADLVTITDGFNTDTLTEYPIASGKYQGKTLKGKIGNIYTLSVKYNQVTYTATDQMNRMPVFDSLYFIKLPFTRPGSDYTMFSNIAYQEPAGKGDNYIAYFWRNDTSFNSVNDLNFTNDQFIDGNPVKDVYIGRPVKLGDKVRIEIHSLSKNAYDYYFQIVNNALRQQSLFAPPPAPYKGNISGDALGFFKASGILSKEGIVK